MDFNKYYVDQATSYPVFKGSTYQRGYGLGNAFRRFISWAIPLLKEYGLPIAKSIGKEIVTNAATVATEALEGKNIKESAKEKILTSLEKLKQQKGNGIKRKSKSSKKLIKKRKLDIFDHVQNHK